jgi:hypothetical protein
MKNELKILLGYSMILSVYIAFMLTILFPVIISGATGNWWYMLLYLTIGFVMVLEVVVFQYLFDIYNKL